MPRRNRRAPIGPPRPIRTLTPAQRDSVIAFARDHLAAHTEAVHQWAKLDERRGEISLCVTGSEHPGTGVMFVSAGEHVDQLAVRLATSDLPGTLIA